MNEIVHLLNQYGYIVLFLSLMLELIIIPIPNEALMTYVGVLCYQGKLNVILSIVTAGTGGILGATISYWIGYKLGYPFFRKFGHFIHLGPEKLDKMSKWYEKYGKVLLVFSFFIPGVRHVASIISGVIKLPFRSFALFAYIGVFLWTGTFISLGKLFGPQVDQYKGEIEKWLILSSIIIGFFAIIYIVVRANRNFIKEALLLFYEYAVVKFKSFLKIKFIIVFFLMLFILFFTLMIGMIQDLVANEFVQFNIISKKIVFSLFNDQWQGIMSSIHILSSWKALGLAAVITILTILLSKQNRWLELIFFISTMIGTFLFSKGINLLFNFLLNNKVSSDFPDEQSMLLMAVYGFLLFMLIRHNRNYFLSVGMFLLFLVILSAYFVSGIYLHDSPNNVIAGYVFSAAWVTGMICALEMFRFLSIIKEKIKKENKS